MIRDPRNNSPMNLAVALTAQDQAAFADALPNAEVAVLLRPPAGTGAVDVKIDNQGRRSLLVFSTPDTLRLWAPDASYGILKGSALPTLAKELSIDIVCFDVAGPAPVEIDPPHLDALLDGIIGESGGTRLIGDFGLIVNEGAPMVGGSSVEVSCR